jgi:hypothetical protein
MGTETPGKTESELLFEEYLGSHGYTDWVYEPPRLAGQSRQPDYLVRSNGQELLLEVKEMHQKEPLPTKAVNIDPYRSVRSEIDEARRKFKDLQEFCCSLIVYNRGDWQARLGTLEVFGAMLGDLGFSWPVCLDEGAGHSTDDPKKIENLFMGGGKMLRPGNHTPQNTTISSIVALERLRAFNPSVRRMARQAVYDEEARLGRELSLEEEVIAEHNVWSSHANSRFNVIRVRVYENPFARRHLPREMFCGPYDMRFAYDLERQAISRVFVGPLMDAMEQGSAERDDSFE